jgi:kumamolisin
VSAHETWIAVPGSAREPIPGARSLGPAYPDEPLTVSVYLRRRAPLTVGTDRRGRGAPALRLTRDEFRTRYGARPEDLARLRAFANERSLRVVREDVAARSVALAGSSAILAEAFGVELRRFTHKGGSYRGHTGPVRLPSELAERVVGVLGLDNRPQAKPHFRHRQNPQPGDVAYSPLEVAAAYAFPPATDGTGQTIGLIELGGGYTDSDLTTYFQNNGLTAPTVTAVSVDGAVNAPTGDPDGPDAEVELDLEVAGAIAPGARFAVYFAPNTEQGFVDAVSAAVHDTSLAPDIVSVSWGGPEGSWSDQSRTALNATCEDAATLGLTVLAAAGDDGADDGDTTGTPTVDFPASSPYVLAAGGTHLSLRGTTILGEQVWNDLAEGDGATGGGVSEEFPLPSYQDAANVPKAPDGFVGRGVPDIAGDADPATGYSVFVDGEGTTLGGTSAVAPLWAALIARLNQSMGTRLGFVAPRLYNPPVEATFHAILSGNNDGYSAGPGWNACTGLGSPDGAKLLAALETDPPLPKKPARTSRR